MILIWGISVKSSPNIKKRFIGYLNNNIKYKKNQGDLK